LLRRLNGYSARGGRIRELESKDPSFGGDGYGASRQSARGGTSTDCNGAGNPCERAAGGDTSSLAKEAQSWLADLIRIDTVNPPGNEQVAAKYVAGILEKEGITAEILDLTPGRSAVVARLRSAAVADPAKALLLVAHMDVVAVDKFKWTVDPFGGVIKDGYLYGRGAIDDKGMLAANLAAFVALKRANLRLNRDVIFLATADEETEAMRTSKL